MYLCVCGTIELQSQAKALSGTVLGGGGSQVEDLVVPGQNQATARHHTHQGRKGGGLVGLEVEGEGPISRVLEQNCPVGKETECWKDLRREDMGDITSVCLC